MKKENFISIASWLVALWTAKVFLTSLPYKFSNAPDTQHIFGTIGEWMKGVLGETIGESFINYGAVAVGTAEATTSFVILVPAVLFLLTKMSLIEDNMYRAKLHCLGGLMAAGIMLGAVFFHLFTPLGIVVLHNGNPDGGSLFMAAVSILVLGALMCLANLSLLRDTDSA